MESSSIANRVSKNDEDQVNKDVPARNDVNNSQKKSRRKVWKSMFCCFGRIYHSKNSESHPEENGQYSPHLPQPIAYRYLLPSIKAQETKKKCMIIDLDETLVHSSFKPISNADFIVPVEIDGTVHQVYVLKRPYVDEFLEKMGHMFECVLFTASLAKYADPVVDLLDKAGVFKVRLFREACVYHHGNYVKDLSRLGRDLNQVVIVDNSPASYIFHPDNAVPVVSWFDDMSDTELRDLIPFLEALSGAESVYSYLKNHRHPHSGRRQQEALITAQTVHNGPPPDSSNPISSVTNTGLDGDDNPVLPVLPGNVHTPLPPPIPA